jgi:hypothetical protein
MAAGCVAVLLSACVTPRTAGKIMVAGGGALTLVGTLDAVGAFGGGCQERSNGTGSSITSCSSGGARNTGAVTTIGIGVALAAAGALVWLLSAPEGAAPAAAAECVGTCAREAQQKPLEAAAAESEEVEVRPPPCGAEMEDCRQSLDPRRVLQGQ